MVVAFVAVEKTSFSYDSLFCYVVPKEFIYRVFVGSFVVVPFGVYNKKRQGFVFKLEERDDVLNLKNILGVLSYEKFVPEELIFVAKYLHSICFCSWFESVKAVVPNGFFYSLDSCWNLKKLNFDVLDEEEKNMFLFLEGIKNVDELNLKIKEFFLDREKKEILNSLKEKEFLVEINKTKRKILNKDVMFVRVKNLNFSDLKLTEKQKTLFEYIKENGELTLKKACYFCGVTSVVAKNLEKLGLIEIFEKHVYKDPYKEVKKTRDVKDIILNEEQNVAKEGILNFVKREEFKVCLLKGVTGSGKTQVFLKLIDYVLKKGKDCIFLVPEISLTAQLIGFFRSFFGDLVAVLHSGLSNSQQVDEYLRIFNGKAKLIIGTRSAVFAPCRNLGLVVMDEEDGSCYKSSDMSPRYNAKDIAKYRCFKSCCVLVLASATPLIETNFLALNKKYERFVLNKRYSSVGLPKVFVVDMNKAKMSCVNLISQYLFDEIVRNIEKKEQTILFLNRRGYNLGVFCLDCKQGIKCFNCSALMVFHKTNNSFICHHCGAIRKNVKVCDNCNGDRLVYCGQGTQNIEDLIKKAIKNVRVLRLDADATFSREEFEEKIKKFQDGEYDLLLGTQLVAKGLNFKDVTLVGVLSIDGILFGADFKSSERAFSLLTQVVGRSGRENKVGKAIIQTYNPKNKIIAWAAKQDYDVFYQNEIKERKEFFCPPFCDIYIVNFSGHNKQKLLVCAREFIEECKKNAIASLPFKILGISIPYVEMVNKRYKKRIIIKCRNTKNFREWMRFVAKKVFSSKSFSSVRANIDINGDIL